MLAQREFCTKVVLLVGALLIPATVTGQQVVHISRARTAVALSITGRALPDGAAMVTAAQKACPSNANDIRDAMVKADRAVAAAEPPGLPLGLVLITVTTQARNAECRVFPDDVANLTAAAIELRPPVPHAPITRVQVAIAGQPVTPALERTIRTVPLWSRNEPANTFAVQLALPIAHFAADQNGSTRPVALLISRLGATEVERVELTGADVDALWRLALPVRAAAAGVDVRWAATINHPAPIAVKDLPVAATVLQQLSVIDDSLASRALARQLLATEPCLRLPSDAPASANVQLERFRPSARCHARGAADVAWRSALVPGLGQATSRWRTVAGIAVLGVVSQRLHASQTSKRNGRDYHQRYLSATSFDEADKYWALADNARRRTDVQIVQAGIVWLGALAEAQWHEWRLRKRLRFAAPITPADRPR
jgi:hypothetical protein